MNLIVKSPVWDDLRTIGFRIAKDNPDAAECFVTAAEAAFELLRQHPRIGRLRSFFQNYLVFYLPTSADVQILAVLHGARDLASALAHRLE